MKSRIFATLVIGLTSLLGWSQANNDITLTIQNQNQDSSVFTFDIYANTTSGTTYLGDADIALTTAAGKWSTLAISSSNVDADIAALDAQIIGGEVVINIQGNIGATSTADFPAITTTPKRLATFTVTDVSNFTITPDFAFKTNGNPTTLIYEVYTQGSRLRQRKVSAPVLTAPAAGTAPASAVAGFAADFGTAGQVDLSWTAATDSVLIIGRKTSAVATGPINTVGFNANNSFGDGDQLNVGAANREFVVGKLDGSATSATISNLESGTVYHFAIYKFSGGNGRTEAYSAAATATGTSLSGEPTTAASNIVFSGISSTGFNISWTQGDGDNVLVVLRHNDSTQVTPTDGTGYTGNTDFSSLTDSTGNGNYIMLSAANTGTVSVSGLTAGNEYFVEIYEYNGSSASANYLTSSFGQASQYSFFPEPSTAFAGVTVAGSAATTIDVSWTDPAESDNQWLIVGRLSTDAATAPDSKTTYTASTTYGSGDAIGNGFVVYNGDGSAESFTVSGLDQNETYEFDVYAYTGLVAADDSVINYSDASAGSGSDVTWLETSLTVFLEGPFDGVNDMSAVNITVPSAQPYNAAPWNYSGTETNGSIAGNVVDWVLIELRTSAAGSDGANSVQYTQAALLLDDGSIVAADGSSTPVFELTSEDSFYVAIHHRNHLAVSSDTALTDNGASAFTYNFATQGATGVDGMYDYNGDGSLYVMYAGWVDPTTDAIINAGDYSAVYTDRNNTSATYDLTDANMDGVVDAADRAAVFNNRDYSEQVPAP